MLGFEGLFEVHVPVQFCSGVQVHAGGHMTTDLVALPEFVVEDAPFRTAIRHRLDRLTDLGQVIVQTMAFAIIDLVIAHIDQFGWTSAFLEVGQLVIRAPVLALFDLGDVGQHLVAPVIIMSTIAGALVQIRIGQWSHQPDHLPGVRSVGDIVDGSPVQTILVKGLVVIGHGRAQCLQVGGVGREVDGLPQGVRFLLLLGIMASGG